MKIFVYAALLWASFAQAAISPMDQALKNVGSNGKETVGQYLERNKGIVPKALLEKWTKDPAVKNLPMVPIEVSNTQGKLIFYFKDTSKKQHTMVWRAEKNNLFTFDGTPIPAVQFIDQDSMIRNITGRDYKLRKMIEKPDPKMWTHAFRTVYLPSVKNLKTKEKEKFLAYHRTVLMFWLQARKVATHKKMVASATETQNYAEFLFSAVFASAEANATKCIERGFIGTRENPTADCVIKGDVDCGSGKRSCNSNMYGKSSDGKFKCGVAKGGDDDCAAAITTASPLAKMDDAAFLQVNTVSGLKGTLSAAEKVEAEKFAKSFLQTSGDLKLPELDAAYKTFQSEVSDAYSLCRSEFEKKAGETIDPALRKKCLTLKKQEVLLAAGLDNLNTDKKYVYTKDQVQTCDNSALPTCDTPEAVGQTTCYKGFSCHTTGLAIGAGVAGVAGIIFANSKSSKGNDTPVTPPVWPPADPCNVDGAPTYMCSDPEKCKSPYDFSTVYNACKPPVCGVGQSYNEAVKGCVDHCTNQNIWIEKWKKDNPTTVARDADWAPGEKHTSPGYLEPLNCFNSSCVAPKIWNPWAKKCEEPQDCTQIATAANSTGMMIGGGTAPDILASTMPFVRDQFNQCVVPPCGYGTEQDWYTGACVPYANWVTCPGMGFKVPSQDRCSQITPMTTDSTGTTSGSTGGTR